jgi:flagellum-specific peptidoglycan hydrolase FlgJ
MLQRFLVISVILFLPFLGLALGKRSKETAFSPIYLGKFGKYSKWIKAQARHETGNFTSDIYKRLNNAFGMKDASRRLQFGEDVQGEYRKYKHIGESVKDFIQWMEYTNFPADIDNIEKYISALKERRYFEDAFDNYLKGVQSFL